MAQLKFGSAGVTSREIDISAPLTQEPTGVPAGVIGTANRGPAFVPVTIGNVDDFYSKFGKTDGEKQGPLAMAEWMRNASAGTYVRILGVGDGKRSNQDGSVNNAGFTVGENLPRSSDGLLASNSFANTQGVPGRLYFLGALMSESAGSTIFSDAGLQGSRGLFGNASASCPIVRGVLMAPSGVILRLSSSAQAVDNTPPASSLVAADATAKGSLFGNVVLLSDGVSKQEFVMILNGHKGTDPLYPNVITASFDMTAPNYFGNVFNTDPYKIQDAGHYLHSSWDIYPAMATLTGTAVLSEKSGSGASLSFQPGSELIAFLTTGSLARNTGNSTVPNYEAWTDRFSSAKTPWVISQKFGGNAANLFRLHAIDAGAGISTQFKFSIENIAPSTDPANKYASFDVVIRDFNDNDMNVKYVEQWRGVNLDPTSDRYIAKVIGDVNAYYNFDTSDANQNLVIDGSYNNRSNIVRVEVSDVVDGQSVDPTALPMGVRGIPHLVTSGSAPMTSPATSPATLLYSVTNVLKNIVQAPVPLRSNITQGSGTKVSVNPLLYWGVRFEHPTSLLTPNASTLQDASLRSFAKYFPTFSETQQNVVVGDNAGTPATAANGILDSDAFNNNVFTLENIQVVTGSSGYADPNSWSSAVYVRKGNIVANDTNKTRALTSTDFIQSNRRFLKFTFLMNGGFNGTNVFDRDEAEINNAAVVADMNDANRGRQSGPNVMAYQRAIDVMKNTTAVDIQLLTTPGIRHPIVTDNAVLAVEDRFDAMYIMDVEQLDSNYANIVSDEQMPSVSLTVDTFRNRSVDTSFAAAYFPDQVVLDPNTKTNVMVAPSVAVLGALALNDKVGHPWFAPAGFTRGALQTTLEARVKLSKANMDALYDVNINPIVAFPGNSVIGTQPTGGVVVWGQKTLQVAASALDRVNVRRLLINIRREVKDVAQTIIFEPTRDATLAKFSAAITPKLQRVQALGGLNRFNIIIDSSTTTQADIENNTLRGKIIVQPTKVNEFVFLDFVVTNNINEQSA